MSPSVIFLLIWLCGLIAFVSLIATVLFWLRRKKHAYIVSIIVFVIFTLLTAFFAVGYFTPAEVIEIKTISTQG